MAGVEDPYYEYLKRQHHLATHMELNDLNVNNVLDEIRPYVEMDGGYLEYIAIDYTKEGPVVMVRLLGACSTCAMSSQTMSMGIEKLVKEKFPEVYRVVSV